MAEQYASADAETPAPGTLSETVGYAFALFRRHFLRLLPLGIVFHAAFAGYLLYLSRAPYADSDPGLGLVVLHLLMVILFCWVWAFGARCVHDQEAAGDVEPYDGHAGLFGRVILLFVLFQFLSVLAVFPLVFLMEVGGVWLAGVVAIVSGLYLSIRCWMVPVVMGVEDRYSMDAIGRSWKLTSGGPAFLLALGVVLFALAATAVPGMLWKLGLDAVFYPGYLMDNGTAFFWWLGVVGGEALLFPLFIAASVAALHALQAGCPADAETDAETDAD